MKKFAGDIIILCMCTKNHNHMIYGSWNMKWGRHNFLSFWTIFCPFTTPYLPKWSQKSEFWKKKMVILSFDTYICTIIEDHMIYGSWNIRCNRQKFLTFWDNFCPFSSMTTWKIKILTLKKAVGDIVLHICTITDNHMMYGSWDMEHNRHNFLSFWTVFCPFTPLLTQKIKILKKWKKHLNIWSFYKCIP